MLFLSNHREGSAGHYFDNVFCHQEACTYHSLRGSGFYRYFSNLLSIFFIPIFGYHGSVVFIRLLLCLRFWKAVLNSEKVVLSRSIAPILPRLIKDISILYHNNESLYYYEEYVSESRIVYKILNYHQSFVLSFYELFSIYKSNVYTLSKSEFHFLRRKGISSIFIVEFLYGSNIISPLQIVDLNDHVDDRNLCFFGDYSNTRNCTMAAALIKKYKKISLFGRNGDCLPFDVYSNYKGEIVDFSDVVNEYILLVDFEPRAGVQTKVIDWLIQGGRVCISKKLKRRMGL